VSLVGFSLFLISFSHQNDQRITGMMASLELPFVVGVPAVMDGVMWVYIWVFFSLSPSASANVVGFRQPSSHLRPPPFQSYRRDTEVVARLESGHVTMRCCSPHYFSYFPYFYRSHSRSPHWPLQFAFSVVDCTGQVWALFFFYNIPLSRLLFSHRGFVLGAVAG
jgi:hypothetical protein